MRKNTQLKNIFCLEGLWDGNLNDQSTVLPAIELLSKHRGIRCIHSRCATKSELDFYLSKWSLKKYDDYPVLYLAFHGEKDSIRLMGEVINLNYISDLLKGKCKGRVVIFGSCSTLDIDLRHLKRFLKTTGALAIGGYKTDIDWVLSTANDLLLFEALQSNEFSERGIPVIKRKMMEVAKRFKELGFRMVTSSEI
ncbi:MAG: hypothetical protein JXR10_06915 [Cyclobacteriaceae bacterium]